MPWVRPPDLPVNRTDATPQQTTHPADHNAIGAAVNNIGVKVQDHDYYLSATGADGIGNVGKVVQGATPAGDVAVSTERSVATITLPAGSWLIHYNVQLASVAAIAASVKMFGTTAGTRTYQVNAPVVGAAAYAAPHMTTLARGPGTVSVNIGNGGTATIATYADPTNHQIFAVGLVTF